MSAVPENAAERNLILFLRFVAIVTGAAIVPALMPLAWMNVIHQRLGMGDLPSGPIVEYLARSTSAFYALHGILLWIISTDLKRFAPILNYMIWTMAICGVGLGVLDWKAGLPPHWLYAEAPIVLTLAGTMWALRRNAALNDE